MDSSGRCPRFFSGGCGESMQSKLDSPMPWIGMYVAAASTFVALAMAVDVFYGFKSKKFWIPSKFFTMNAFSLTILAVAMKLPVDLTNQMLGVNEILARVSSLALMSIVTGNLMTSLGTLENNEIMLNLAALGSLVITIIVNVCIHIAKMLETVGKGLRNTVTLQIYTEQIICTVFMFILLVLLCSSALIVPSLRRCVDNEYNLLCEKTSTKQMKWGKFDVYGLRTVLREYWVNAKIANPQFLIARSETCAASGAMCLLTALTLLEAWLRMHFVYKGGANVGDSNYKWSINWIVIIQTIGVGLGMIAPMFRWFLAAKLKSFNIRHCINGLLKITHFEDQMLYEWGIAQLDPTHPRSSLEIQRSSKLTIIVQIAKYFVARLCRLVQCVIVVASRLLLLVSAACVKVILLCFPHNESSFEIDSACSNLHEDKRLDTNSVESIGNEVDKLIEMGKKKQPKYLINLLQKSVNFKGVKEFVNEPILETEDALNRWSLPIVILTSIAVQLPNITTNKIDELLRAVDEGLHFATLIEKSLNVKLEIYKFRLLAEKLWSEVQLHLHCEGINIKRESYEETLETLAHPKTGRFPFPYRTMVTSSIRRISSAIIKYKNENGGITEEELFERISVVISDILSACLTNLVPLITFKCTSSGIEERARNVGEAAILLGRAEEILEMLGKRKLPGLDPDQAAYLGEWWSFMEQNPN